MINSGLTLRRILSFGLTSARGLGRAEIPVLPVSKLVAESSIPGPFTETQAQLILSLHGFLHEDGAGADEVERLLSSTSFSAAQIACIHELLTLDEEDLRAVLADAMEYCELRDQLRFSTGLLELQ